MPKTKKSAKKNVDGLIEKRVDSLLDNKSLVSITLRRIADEFDTLVMVNDHLIKENQLLEREVQILLKELDFENSEGLRRIIRAKATITK